jgi:hypothetical protein
MANVKSVTSSGLVVFDTASSIGLVAGIANSIVALCGVADPSTALSVDITFASPDELNNTTYAASLRAAAGARDFQSFVVDGITIGPQGINVTFNDTGAAHRLYIYYK